MNHREERKCLPVLSPANNCSHFLNSFFFCHFYLTLPDTFEISLVLKNSLQELAIIVHAETPFRFKVLIIMQHKNSRGEKWHMQCQKCITYTRKFKCTVKQLNDNCYIKLFFQRVKAHTNSTTTVSLSVISNLYLRARL